MDHNKSNSRFPIFLDDQLIESETDLRIPSLLYINNSPYPEWAVHKNIEMEPMISLINFSDIKSFIFKKCKIDLSSSNQRVDLSTSLEKKDNFIKEMQLLYESPDNLLQQNIQVEFGV